MPPSERAICRRLREFRVKTGLSQAQFAALVGLNLSGYAGFEYFRTQLNYRAARKILGVFWNLNPVWLAEGSEEMLGKRDFTFPPPEECGAGHRALFSSVFEHGLRAELLKLKPATIVNTGIPVRWFAYDATPQGILNNIRRFDELLSAWLPELQSSRIAEFLDELFLRGAQIYARYPREKDKEVVAKRKTIMYQIEKERSFPTPAPVKTQYGRSLLKAEKEFQKRYDRQNEKSAGSRAARTQAAMAAGLLVPLEDWHAKKDLTDSENAGISIAVKEQLPGLLERLKKATRQSGKKSELAKRVLRVPLASVSRWLSGDREPGGEVALKMLRWVEQQERQR